VPCCGTTTETVNTPGTAGGNAWTTTTEDITIPAGAGPGAVNVGTTAWMAVGQIVFISDDVDYAHFQVTAIPSTTQVTLDYLGYNGDAVNPAVIGSGAQVSPAGPTLATPVTIANGGTGAATAGAARSALLEAALDAEAALTNNTGDTADDTIAAGVGMMDWFFYVILANITGAIDVIGAYTPGYAFKILKVDFLHELPVTTGGKAATLTPKIGGSAVTGGVLSLSGTYAAGAVTAASAVTAANTGAANATFTISATGVTAFTEGNGIIRVRVQNTDTVHAVSSLAAKLNTVLAALKP